MDLEWIYLGKAPVLDDAAIVTLLDAASYLQIVSLHVGAVTTIKFHAPKQVPVIEVHKNTCVSVVP